MRGKTPTREAARGKIADKCVRLPVLFSSNDHPELLMPTPASSIQLQQQADLSVLRVENRHATAHIALQGGQVLTYTRRSERPLLWLSEQAEYRRGQSLRGGIPVCWPWFGDLARNPDAVQRMATANDNIAAHGFVRTLDWHLHTTTEQADSTELVLRYSTANGAAPASWPHAAELLLTISIGKSLQLRLTTRNLDTTALSITQALHTYFAISDIEQVAVSGLEDCRYIDTLDNWRERPQHGAVRFTAETDRIYLDTPAQVQLQDAGWQRTIYLRTKNSASAVVWNPWIEKSKRLSQFATNAWRDMVCIETANVRDDMQTLPPNAEHTLELELWAEQT